MDASTLIAKMIRAAKLDVSLYEEVEADTRATSEALTVVIIVAIAGGISGFFSGLMVGSIGSAILGLIGGIILSLVGYFVWSFLTYWIGTSFLGGTATYGELLRTIGFANSPNVLQIVGFIPCIGWLIALAAGIWSLVCAVVAVRQALDFDTGKAIITAVIGWIVWLLIRLFFTAVFGLGAAAIPR